MRESNAPFSWPLICSILLSLCGLIVTGKCLGSQQSLLLELKNSLDFSNEDSTKLLNWNESSDCCSWKGVTCEVGRVTNLNLSHEGIGGSLDNSSVLFNLHHLKSLDMSHNNFNSVIPSRIGNLANLSHLNLACSGLGGQVPIDISHLRSLITLDLSSDCWYGSNLEIPNLSMLVQNLSKLQEIHLDGANISTPGNSWCQALSSSLPNLRVLSLSNCHVPGPLDQSLVMLQSLSVLHLEGTNLSSTVPQFLAKFSNLTLLNLRGCGLQGTFPNEIFQVQTLEFIDISSNQFLKGTLPVFPVNGSLKELHVSSTKFEGSLPASLDSVPSFILSTKLVHIDLSHNCLTGEIPLSLFALPLLETILLSNNQFSGPIHELKTTSSASLETLDLSRNNLEGLVPTSFFKFGNLMSLNLSYNKFTGSKHQKMIPESSTTLFTLDISYNSLKSFLDLEYLPWLLHLNLSYNNLTLLPYLNNAASLSDLYLSHNNLESFPDLKNLSSLRNLDLSFNNISGEIPEWISEVGTAGQFGVFMEPNSIKFLDLHFNQLQGNIPVLPEYLIYLDLSSNNFTSLQYDHFYRLSRLSLLSLSNNSLTGVIPERLCVVYNLLALDFSHNNLSGEIPTCFIETSGTREMLNLRKNNIHGPIPDVFPRDCNLKALDLNGNAIGGEIPKSLANCSGLQVLDLGNNELIGKFPSSLKKLSSLHVLILRSNKLFGSLECLNANGSWPMLQIFDLAHNNFSGELPRKLLKQLQRMTVDEDDAHSHFLSLDRRSLYRGSPGSPDQFTNIHYVYTVQVTSKGFERELPKILDIFTYIDLSTNNFHGPIPVELGELKALYTLNLSNNALSGKIDSSIGKLKNLESLDLSRNDLTGKIPAQIQSLSFLSFLNLSFNQLVGMIPTGSQLQTFSEDSFIGNRGLCGFPLRKNCSDKGAGGTSSSNSTKDSESNPGRKINWNLLSAEIGLFTGLGLVSPLVLSRRWRIWYYERVDDIIFKILPLAVSRKWFLWTAT